MNLLILIEKITNKLKEAKKLLYFMKIHSFMNENHVIHINKVEEKPINILNKIIILIHICELFAKPYVEIDTKLENT